MSTFAARFAASLLLAVGALAVHAEESDQRPLTAIEAGPLGRSSLVVLAAVETVRGVRGMALAQIRPERAIKGDLPEDDAITVLVPGVRPTGDQERPSVPYLTEAAAGHRYVFFLRPARGGVAWRMVTLFDAQGKVGAQKLASLDKVSVLLAIHDPDERAQATLDWLLEAQRAKGTWTRVNAARELNHLLEVRRDLFDDAVRSSIRRLASRGCVPAQRTWLVRALKDLGALPPETAPSAPPERPDALEEALTGIEDADARIRILEEHLHRGGPTAAATLIRRIRHEDALVRTWMIKTFAEGGYATHLPAIRTLYAYEANAEVRRAIVYATGRLGSDADVTWLEERTLSPSVQRDALFALARIRTEAALAALARVRERPVDGSVSGDIPALVDYLRSSAFEEVEAAAGRSVGGARDG